MTAADRLGRLPPYLFVEIDRRRREAIAAGRDVIDFGVGDPDQPTHSFIVDRLTEAARNAANHRYASSAGSETFRGSVARFFQRRFGVTLDPDREVVSLLGTKEGIGHLPLAIINPGDVVLIPEPGYPVYTSGTHFAGGDCHVMPLQAERRWLPDLGAIPKEVRRRAKLLFLNYPNNPTGAVAPRSFLEEAVSFAREYGLLLAQDAAYSEVYFDDPPPSILEIDGAKDVAIEFHSLSKTFNMTGWRVGFAVGQSTALAALLKVKNNLDSGIFGAIQDAAAAALDRFDDPAVRQQVAIYRRRRDALVTGLRDCGWRVESPGATFYVWAQCPPGHGAMEAAMRILAEADVVVVPGVGFGPAGEGSIRFALTVSEDRTREAVARIARLRW